MPNKPKRPCSYPGCPRLTGGLFCEEHKRQEQHAYNHYRRDPKTAKRYGAGWRRIHARYVAEHPLCESCLQYGRYIPVEEVHHIVPLTDGGTNDFQNLMSLCKSCHSAITIDKTNRGSRGIGYRTRLTIAHPPGGISISTPFQARQRSWITCAISQVQTPNYLRIEVDHGKRRYQLRRRADRFAAEETLFFMVISSFFTVWLLTPLSRGMTL